MKRNHHVNRYREAIWRCRKRKWFFVCRDDNGAPVVIADAKGQALARAIYHEHMRRRRIGADR